MGKKVNKSNLLLILVIVLIGIIVGMFIFNKRPNPSTGLETERDILLEQKEELQKQIDNQKDSVIFYKEKDREWIEKDSLKDIEIAEAQAESKAQKERALRAERDRKKSQKELEEFRKNPPTINDPIDLIIDTKKRIDEE